MNGTPEAVQEVDKSTAAKVMNIIGFSLVEAAGLGWTVWGALTKQNVLIVGGMVLLLAGFFWISAGDIVIEMFGAKITARHASALPDFKDKETEQLVRVVAGKAHDYSVVKLGTPIEPARVIAGTSEGRGWLGPAVIATPAITGVDSIVDVKNIIKALDAKAIITNMPVTYELPEDMTLQVEKESKGSSPSGLVEVALHNFFHKSGNKSIDDTPWENPKSVTYQLSTVFIEEVLKCSDANKVSESRVVYTAVKEYFASFTEVARGDAP
jgi:hypothetical protein